VAEEVLGGAHIGASLEECVAKQWRSSFTYCPEAVVSPTCGPRPCLCRKDDGSLAHDHAGQASQAKDRAGATRAWDKTNRETIERALDTVLAEEQVRRALRRAGGTGGIEDVFGRS